MMNQILALEDVHQFWEPEIRGVKLWPLIRTFVLLKQYSQGRDLATKPRPSRIKKYSSRGNLSRYYRTLGLMLSESFPSYTSLFFTYDLGRYNDTNSDYSFDRLHGEFFKHSRAPLIFEGQSINLRLFPDRYYPNEIYSQDLLWLWCYAASIAIRFTPHERSEIQDFVDRIVNIYDLNKYSEEITRRIYSLLSKYPSLQHAIHKYIDPRMHNKAAFIQISSYLGRQGLLNKILHELDYQIIELQHGIIHPRHYAYNYSPEVLTSSTHPANEYLPDYLLTFGNQWSDYIRSPSKIYPIGSPHLSSIVQGIKGSHQQTKEGILVISQWTVVDKMIEISMGLAKAFPERKIIYKLHPAEIDALDEFKSRLGEPNIEVSSTGNVYELLAATPMVVGFNSTVLVEATAFPGTRIFFLDQEIIPPEVGSHFSSSEELISMISDPEKGIPRSHPSAFWEPDWSRRIADFISQIGIL